MRSNGSGGSMRWNDLRIPWIAAGFVLVLLLLMAGERIWSDQRQSSWARQFEAMSGVRSVSINSGVEPLLIKIELGPVRDFKKAYLDLEALATRLFGSGRFRLEIVDRRNPELEEAFYRIHFALQQGAATGDFEWMRAAVERMLVQSGVYEHREYVTDDRIYVQIGSGDSYLYEVVERPSALPTGTGRALRGDIGS